MSSPQETTRADAVPDSDLPGPYPVGQYAAQSVQALDIPPVLVITMFGAFMVVVIGAVIDVVYAMLDPRIRL